MIEKRTTNNINAKKHAKFAELLRGKTTLLIVMQDNPDPDSIAAAAALRKIANALAGIKCSIAHGGTVGRGENRALVRYLDLNMHLCKDIAFDRFDLTAIVDTQPGTGNNSLPDSISPDIVFDHHPMKKRTRNSQFFDVRPNIGATATILVEYLTGFDVNIDIPLATALLYAIRSDTQDLGREATKADIETIELLYPVANKRMLSDIQRGSVPKEYFRLLDRALNNAFVYGPAIVTHLEKIDNPDMIGEVADLLLREENTTWTMCTGLFDGKLLISLRTSDTENRADKVIKQIVARKGTGGGHLTYAGGQVPVKDTGNKKTDRLKEHLTKKFLKAIHTPDNPTQKLV